MGHEVEDAIALRKLHPEEWKLFAPLAENTETAKNIPKAELASVWRSDPEVREGIFQDLRTTHPHFVNAEVEGILADTPRHPTFSAPVLQGSSELAVSDAVWHEPVTLVDSLGNPLRTADTTTARLAEAAYREKAALILDEALSGVPVDQWKSQEKLRAAIATALRKEPARTYSLDVASGKLTLKTKVKGLELSGEMNIYQAATKAVKAGGLAGAGYAAGPVRDLANRFLSKGTDQNKKP